METDEFQQCLLSKCRSRFLVIFAFLILTADLKNILIFFFNKSGFKVSCLIFDNEVIFSTVVILFFFIFLFLPGHTHVGDLASLIFLWNPFTIITCAGSSTSPIDNLMIVLSIYGACSG